MEMLGLTDAQEDRFLYTYELARAIMRELGIFPQKNLPPAEAERQEKLLRRIDDFERGYPRLTLSLFLDIVGRCKAHVNKTEFQPYNPVLRAPAAQAAFRNRLKGKEVPGVPNSWGKLYSLLWRLHRLKVFHGGKIQAQPLKYQEMLQPGRVSVIDLSDAGMTELSNLAVADVLRGIQEAQDAAYRQFEADKKTAPPRVLLVVEEAHEFLSAERIKDCPVLFGQVAQLAKRGRKRWLSLAFVTLLPQHVPRQVLGLCNNFILHKLTDPQVLHGLKQTVSGIEDSLWARLSGLPPGQAIVSFGHMTRPLLASIDPTGCKLRMVD
jgi:DNA helicase HerA-like ATPase